MSSIVSHDLPLQVTGFYFIETEACVNSTGSGHDPLWLSTAHAERLNRKFARAICDICSLLVSEASICAHLGAERGCYDSEAATMITRLLP